jgi:hypothetical protein
MKDRVLRTGQVEDVLTIGAGLLLLNWEAALFHWVEGPKEVNSALTC